MYSKPFLFYFLMSFDLFSDLNCSEIFLCPWLSPLKLFLWHFFFAFSDVSSSSVSPRPKDLITVDTSAITPAKNPEMNPESSGRPDQTMLTVVKNRKRKFSSKSICVSNVQNSLLLKSQQHRSASTDLPVRICQSGSARTDPQKNCQTLRRAADKRVNVVIVPEGFVGDFFPEESWKKDWDSIFFKRHLNYKLLREAIYQIKLTFIRLSNSKRTTII